MYRNALAQAKPHDAGREVHPSEGEDLVDVVRGQINKRGPVAADHESAPVTREDAALLLDIERAEQGVGEALRRWTVGRGMRRSVVGLVRVRRVVNQFRADKRGPEERESRIEGRD